MDRVCYHRRNVHRLPDWQRGRVMLGPLHDTDRPGCGAWITLALFVLFVTLLAVAYVILTAGDAPAWVRGVVL